MSNPDEEMEQYLKEFKPRAIRPLEAEAPSHRFRLRPLAIAAAIGLTAGLSVWVSRREVAVVPQLPREHQAQASAPFTERRMNSFLLTKLALEDNQTFDAVLTEESRKVLPNLQGQGSMLRVLAAE